MYHIHFKVIYNIGLRPTCMELTVVILNTLTDLMPFQYIVLLLSGSFCLSPFIVLSLLC